MSSLRIALCLVLFAIVALGNVISSPKRDHNIDICEIPPPGKKWTFFLSATVEAPGKFLQIVTRELKWPQGGEAPAFIKCIRVTDLSADGTGGYATTQNGGLDFNYVNIHMKSQRNYGLLFRIEILGEPAIPLK